MKTNYPKRGKRQTVKTHQSPANVPDRAERIGSPYFYRPGMGDSDEQKMFRRMGYYGKDAPVEAPEHGGFFVSPARTMIRE